MLLPIMENQTKEQDARRVCEISISENRMNLERQGSEQVAQNLLLKVAFNSELDWWSLEFSAKQVYAITLGFK